MIILIEKYFEEYNNICDDLKSMIMELKVKKDNLYSITGTSYDQSIKSSVHYGIEHYLDEILNLEKKIKLKEDESRSLYAEYLDKINCLKNNKEQIIIKYFYLDHLSIGQIATILYLSEGHIKRLKSQAVKNFEKMLLNVT